MRQRPPRVRITGPLVQYVDGFGRALLDHGYTPLSARSQLELMAHVSRWLAESELGAESLTPARVDEFLAARRGEGHTHLLSPRGMAPLLAHLRGLGVTAIAASEPVNAVERLLADYARFLVRERGFAGATVQRYVGFARRFLAQRAGTDGEVDLAGLSPEEVTQFVLRECSERVPGSAKCGLTRLRSLLRFLHVEGAGTGVGLGRPVGTKLASRLAAQGH